MTQWVDACDESELQQTTYLSVVAGGRLVALFVQDGEYFAVQGVCTHGDAMLTKGEFYDGEIVCPLHQGRFCVKTGETRGGPVWEDLKTYQLQVADGKIQVLMP
jgi:nitrite reductase/ring-hydroxylating ferredoxin subunit